MIDKLNFSGAGANMNIESPQSSIGDSLLTLGKYYTHKDAIEQERLLQAKKDQHALEREGITDARYEADKKERLDDKNRLLQKDYNTANAMSAIENKDAYIAGRMSAEQKAIQDTLSSATPEERLQMQQELKGYDPKASGQQWASTALSQSNVDSKDITNLKRDITKEAEQTRQFNENKRIAQENADRAYSLQKIQYDQTAQEKKNADAGKLAYVNGLNTNVDNSTKVLRDSKTGEKYIPTENLNTHKAKFEEFANSPEMIKMKNELVDAQKNGGQIYTKEQLADPVFMKKLYDESEASKKPQGNITFESILPNFKMMKDLEPYGKKINDLNRNVVANRNATGSDIENAKKEIEIANSEINRIKNEYSKKDSSDSYSTYEDFSTKIKADNAAKELDLKTKIDKYDSAYKVQDLKLKNEFGKIKQEEIVIPKTEDEYAQDLYNANTAGKTLSVDEKVGFMKSAKEKAATHQKNVEKDEDDALKVRLKQMEKANDAQKLEYNTYDDQIKTLNDQISKITTGNASKEDLYSRVTSKEVNPETAILELKTEIEQLKSLQKGLANKIVK